MDMDQPMPSSAPFSLALKPSLQQEHDDLASFSPDSLYNFPLVDDYSSFRNNSYNTDFSADSPLSLGSPISPTTTTNTANTTTTSSSANPYVLSSRDAFDTWTKLEAEDPESNNADLSLVKPEPQDSPVLFAAFPPLINRDLTVSPAVNPTDLSNSNLISTSDAANLIGLPPPLQSEPTPPVSDPCSPVGVSKASSSNAAMPVRDRRYAVHKSSAAPRHGTVASGSLKRKSSSSDSSSPRSPNSPPSPTAAQAGGSAYNPPKKTAHNLIEKRYRTNLNDKILALRDSVPALRIMVRRVDSTGGPSSEDDDNDNVLARFPGANDRDAEDLGGLAPAHKLNKATILSKATEYIAHLERRNQSLARENASLRSKVDGYEMLVMSRGGQNGVWS